MADEQWKRLGDPAEKAGLDEFVQMFKAAAGIRSQVRPDTEVLTDTPRKGPVDYFSTEPASNEFERLKKKTFAEMNFDKLGVGEFPRPGALYATENDLVDIWKMMFENRDFMMGALSADERFRIMVGQMDRKKAKEGKDQFWNPREM